MSLAVAQLPFTFRGAVPAPEEHEEDEARAPIAAKEPEILSVRELQRRLRLDLESRYRAVYVAGEVSNLQIHARSGHCYFTLKDEDAQIKCVMWRDHLARLRFTPKDGQVLIVRGKVTIYERGGSLQMSVWQMEPKGLGALQQQFLDRVEKLRAEGLTRPEKKRPLPRFPRRIGVVTSKDGAALQDVVRTIFRRDPTMQIVLSPAPVQGRESAPLVVQALRRLERHGKVDVVLVVRGGGSLEDLWTFNEEDVARAIAGLSVPVVTGIGHETDTTIADLVADVRASTPTAAAELVVPVKADVELWIREAEQRLTRATRARVRSLARDLLLVERRLGQPDAALFQRAERIDELSSRLDRAARRRVTRARDRFLAAERALAVRSPEARLHAWRHRMSSAQAKLERAGERSLDRAGRRLASLSDKLASLSPLSVLARGYALVETAAGEVLKSASRVAPGEHLSVRLHEGRLRVAVVEVESGERSTDGSA